MARLNLTIPDDLDDRVRSELSDVCLSKVLQESLRRLLSCDHHALRCSRCSMTVDQAEVADEALSRFYTDVLWTLTPLVDQGGTAEGAARLIRRAGRQAGISAADNVPLPRPPRAARRRVLPFPDPKEATRCADSATTSTLKGYA